MLGGLEDERELVTASIISLGAHSLYTSLKSSQSSLKVFTSMSGIFTKRETTFNINTLIRCEIFEDNEEITCLNICF